MSEATFMGVPREKIPWFPTIDYDRCCFCMECDRFCPHQVFERQEGSERKLIVAHRNNCVVFCRACAKACGPDAITFPEKPAIVAMIKMIRQQADEQLSPASPVPPVFAVPQDYLEVAHDKFLFKIPLVGFLFNENDVWTEVDAAGVRARIGISDFAQQQLTDISFVGLPSVGAEVDQFADAGYVESAKATLEVVSPVSGRVVAVNAALADAPETVNQDPYGAGWIAELELRDFTADRDLLIDGPAYAELVKKAAEAA